MACSRCPAVFNNGHNWIIKYTLDGYSQVLFYVPMEFNVFTNFYYEQRYDRTEEDYVVRLYVNDILVKTGMNSFADEYENVKVYTGNAWYPSTDAVVKNFKFGSFDYKNRKTII